MERNDLLIGFYLLASILFIGYGVDTPFLYSTALNLFILGIYFMLYYDFTNYRSHSQYLLKREIKPFYSALINGVLLLGIGRIIYNYGYAIFSWNTSLYPSYQLLIEGFFALIMLLLLVRFIVSDVLEFSWQSKPLDFKPSHFSKSRLEKQRHYKSREEAHEEAHEKEAHAEIIKEKKEPAEEAEESKDEIKRLPVIIITTEE